MTKAKVSLEESDIIRLILQFFNGGKLHKSMRNLEKETCVTNCDLSDDVLFLRQLILDGEWEAILTFSQPLEKTEGFDVRKFRYLVLKQKFMEVLYFKSGIEGVPTSYSIEDLIKCLNQLEKDCPFKSDYTKLCWLLTVPDLSEQPEYQDWNPETARLQCFEEVLELLRNVMPVKKKNGKQLSAPSYNRLMNLIVKGLCFESCVEYCQQRAINGDCDDDNYFTVKGNVMSGTSHDSTGNFISWLKNLPHESFIAPFEPMELDVEYKKIDRVKTLRFSNKNLQNEAESLSRSLTLNSRPATADQVAHVTSQQNGHQAFPTAIRANSALAGVTKVSSSYNEFHYNPKNSHFKPIAKVGSTTQKTYNDVEKAEPYEHKSVTSSSVTQQRAKTNQDELYVETTGGPCEPIDQLDKQPQLGKDRDIHKSGIVNGDQDEYYVASKKNDSFDAVRDSVQILKSEQERNVLRQLEDHERQKQELQKQLMDIKHGSVENTAQYNNGNRATSDDDDYRDFGNHQGDRQTRLHREQENQYPVENNEDGHGKRLPLDRMDEGSHGRQDNRPSPEGLENGNIYTETTPSEEPSLEFDDANFPAANPNYFAVTSTPVSKHKPTPLVLNDQSSVHPVPEEPMTPVNQKDPKTPMGNMLPGHWIALTDGSGVLNTSTPKTTRRNKMTPAPLASPVLAKEDHADGTPLARRRASSCDNLQAKDEQPLSQGTQDPTVRKGPKINGVRRNIVGSQPHLIGKLKNTPAPNERVETKPTRQGKSSQNTPRAKTSSPATRAGSGTSTPRSGNSTPRSGNSTPRSGANSPSSPRGRAGSPIGARARVNSPKGHAESPRGRANSPSGSRGRDSSPSGTKARSSSPSSTTKGRTGNVSSPRAQITASQRQAAAKRQSGKTPLPQAGSGSTFVVDKAPSNGLDSKLSINSQPRQDLQPRQDIQPLTEHNQLEKPQPKSINATYQKQPISVNQSKPDAMNQDELSSVLSRQQEFLKSSSDPIRFVSVAMIEDLQAIRAVAFHPAGQLFAIGANSKMLRICSAAGINSYRKGDSTQTASPPAILFKRNRHHRGSIYCSAWNSTGDLIATGSNDKSIKVLHFDAENYTQVGPELELNIHNGTVRDLAFVSRTGGSAVLVSGGAGNGNIQISDCTTGNSIGQLKGHSGHIMSVFAAKDDIITSGSNDNTVRLWDLRSHRCIDAIATGDSCVASVCVNPAGSLLASGHEDGGCMIYDITAGRTLQFFKPHTADCRSVRFSPDGHYLMSGSYDTSIILQDMQQDLDCSIPPYSVVAEHDDKVIQCRWHPTIMAFVSSSADRTARLWTLDC